mmetsp:Transcript_6386/g.14713  ORF Transcript_6386/g.14713 Transcript_6386/m.14713 type:complete len:208 (+) Transcript_6386:129-752(+)
MLELEAPPPFPNCRHHTGCACSSSSPVSLTRVSRSVGSVTACSPTADSQQSSEFDLIVDNQTRRTRRTIEYKVPLEERVRLFQQTRKPQLIVAPHVRVGHTTEIKPRSAVLVSNIGRHLRNIILEHSHPHRPVAVDVREREQHQTRGPERRGGSRIVPPQRPAARVRRVSPPAAVALARWHRETVVVPPPQPVRDPEQHPPVRPVDE